MTSVSAGHIILTPIQPVGSGRPQQESNPGPPHQKVSALYRLSYHAPLYDKQLSIIGKEVSHLIASVDRKLCASNNSEKEIKFNEIKT